MQKKRCQVDNSLANLLNITVTDSLDSTNLYQQVTIKSIIIPTQNTAMFQICHTLPSTATLPWVTVAVDCLYFFTSHGPQVHNPPTHQPTNPPDRQNLNPQAASARWYSVALGTHWPKAKAQNPGSQRRTEGTSVNVKVARSFNFWPGKTQQGKQLKVVGGWFFEKNSHLANHQALWCFGLKRDVFVKTLMKFNIDETHSIQPNRKKKKLIKATIESIGHKLAGMVLSCRWPTITHGEGEAILASALRWTQGESWRMLELSPNRIVSIPNWDKESHRNKCTRSFSQRVLSESRQKQWKKNKKLMSFL